MDMKQVSATYLSTHPTTTTPLSPFDTTITTTISPPIHPIISTFSTTSTTILLAHGGLISHYSPITLSHLSTTPTHLPQISSIFPVSASISVSASNSFSSPPGLHFFSSSSSPYDSHHHLASLLWNDPSDPRTDKSRVTAVDSDASSESTHLFASFDCRHGENAVLVVDKSTVSVMMEIGRQTGNSAKSAALTRLKLVPSLGILVGSSIACGGFGYSGYIRMWDVRSGKQVWETGGSGRGNRVGDTMADVDVDVNGVFLAKVGSRSGDVGVADMRRLGDDYDDPWVYLVEQNPGLRSAGAVRESAVVHCWNKHVFVARDGTLEAWSTVEGEGKGEIAWGRYRRNYVDKEEDVNRGNIKMIGGGGDRLFVARENVEGLEVWETSRLSGLITIS